MNVFFQLEHGKQFEVLRGARWWSEHGALHRLTGPAIEYPGGIKEWWERGRFIRSKK